jgi:hypothetical protein
MDEEKIIDQTALAQEVSSKIKYSFFDYFLVKPLDPVKVKKEFSKPVSTGTPVEDANGVKAEDFDSVETEVKEVDSDYRTAVVIKLAKSYEKQLADPEQKQRSPTKQKRNHPAEHGGRIADPLLFGLLFHSDRHRLLGKLPFMESPEGSIQIHGPEELVQCAE